MIADGWPDEDATVLRYGLRRLYHALPLVTVLLAGGGVGVWIPVSFGFRVDGIAVSWTFVGMLLLSGIVGAGLLVSR
jgi:hypothetical protein